MMYSGNLIQTTRCNAPVRVIAAAYGRLLAEAPVSADGHWRLKTDKHADAIIAQQHRSAVSAVYLTPQPQIRIKLPEMVTLEFKTDVAPYNLPGWLDPAALEGFPDNMIGLLFARSGGLIDLHVCEFELTPDQKRVKVPVQRGRYRLSAGTVAIRPGFGDRPLQLAGVTDMNADKLIKRENGVFKLNIVESARFRLHFSEAVLDGDRFTLSI